MTWDGEVGRGLRWLHSAQLSSGELPSFATSLEDREPAWVADQLNFITALAATAVAEVDDPLATEVIDRAVRFLQVEREWPGLWRYWARTNPKVDFTPPDADDTACCSIAVALRGHRTDRNRAILQAARDEKGRFFTWLLPRGRAAGASAWWAQRDERRTATVAMRADLWGTTEADPDDIDAVVNANVCRHLGPGSDTDRSADWVAEVVGHGSGTHDKWHHAPAVLWDAVADGARRGVGPFMAARPTVLEQIEASGEQGAAPRTSYEAALMLRASLALRGPRDLCLRLADEVLAAQRADGSWPRDTCYHGGPREVFAWASEALTTAVAVGALHSAGRLAR